MFQKAWATAPTAAGFVKNLVAEMMKKYSYVNCIDPELWINLCHIKDKLKFSISNSKWSQDSNNRLLWLMLCCFSLRLSLFCKSAQNTSVFNISCGIGVIWEDNLEHRDESSDINETKACDCHWHSFKENIQTDWGLLFTWEGRGLLWCIWYLSTHWRPTFVLIQRATCSCLCPSSLLTFRAGKSQPRFCYSTWMLRTKI